MIVNDRPIIRAHVPEVRIDLRQETITITTTTTDTISTIAETTVIVRITMATIISAVGAAEIGSVKRLICIQTAN
jgi:hypothetical protein